MGEEESPPMALLRNPLRAKRSKETGGQENSLFLFVNFSSLKNQQKFHISNRRRLATDAKARQQGDWGRLDAFGQKISGEER